MAQLKDLHPSIVQLPTGLHAIRFDCPLCGPPYQVSIQAKFNGQPANSVWSWTFTNVEDYKITITPSINNANHGRKKLCGWHGSVIEGVVS